MIHPLHYTNPFNDNYSSDDTNESRDTQCFNYQKDSYLNKCQLFEQLSEQNSSLQNFTLLYQEQVTKEFTTYAKELMMNSNSLDISFKINPLFLTKKNIDELIHIQMVDWMVEVLGVNKSFNETFFLSVQIMDYFLDKTSYNVKPHDIYLIGIVCLFIASKFFDIEAITLENVEVNLGKKMFSQ